MAKLIFYVLFGCNSADSSKIYIYNGSSVNYYFLIPKDKRILVSKEIASHDVSFLNFSYFKNSYIQSVRKTDFMYLCSYDTIFIRRKSDVSISFKAIKNDGADTIPIQNMFWLQLRSARVGTIRKDGEKYYALKSKRILCYDYRNFIGSQGKFGK